MIDRSVRSMINDRDYEGADVGDHRPYPRTVYAIHYPGRQKRKKKEREKNTKRGRGGGGEPFNDSGRTASPYCGRPDRADALG